MSENGAGKGSKYQDLFLRVVINKNTADEISRIFPVSKASIESLGLIVEELRPSVGDFIKDHVVGPVIHFEMVSPKIEVMGSQTWEADEIPTEVAKMCEEMGETVHESIAEFMIMAAAGDFISEIQTRKMLAYLSLLFR